MKKKRYGSKKYALENGIKESNGEIILSTDADCRVLKTGFLMSSSLNETRGITIGFSEY